MAESALDSKQSTKSNIAAEQSTRPQLLADYSRDDSQQDGQYDEDDEDDDDDEEYLEEIRDLGLEDADWDLARGGERPLPS